MSAPENKFQIVIDFSGKKSSIEKGIQADLHASRDDFTKNFQSFVHAILISDLKHLPRSVKHNQSGVNGFKLTVKVCIAQFQDIVGLDESHESNQQKNFEHVAFDDSRIQVLTSRAEL